LLKTGPLSALLSALKKKFEKNEKKWDQFSFKKIKYGKSNNN
jgi:hypothetical protein